MSTYATRSDERYAEAVERDLTERDSILGTFDVESFTDWISAECMNVPDVQLRRQIHEVTPCDFKGQPLPETLAIACDRGQPRLTRLAALDCLLEVFDVQMQMEAAAREDAVRALAVSQAECLERVRAWTHREAA